MAPQGAIFLRKHIRPSCGAGEKCSQWNEIVFCRHCEERSDEAIHSVFMLRQWIASRSLSSGAHSRDPLTRNDGFLNGEAVMQG